MDKLVNEFTVNRPIDEAWKILTDVERIAPCMPGATLEEIEGDVFRGVVKIKLGAISTAFKGQASFVERDDDAHRAVLKGEGRDTTGKGNPTATSGVRKINGPAAAPIELSDVAGSAILKRVLPVVGGLVLMLIIIRRLRRR